MAEVDLRLLAKAVEDPAYVVVGFGVLGLQRAQVARREWQQRLAVVTRGAARAANEAAELVSEGVGPLANEAAERAGEAAYYLAAAAQQHLPPEAHELLRATRDLLSDIPGTARELAEEAASFGRAALGLFAPAPRPARR